MGSNRNSKSVEIWCAGLEICDFWLGCTSRESTVAETVQSEENLIEAWDGNYDMISIKYFHAQSGPVKESI